tara:strand:- start:682 stop:1527 length:846 start_codon:yes stop_codon:yes gene_type:complete
MNTITLPDELNLDSSLPISVYNYESVNEISKQQVLLNQNTFSFLQAGTKEVYFDNSSYAIDNSEFLLMKSGHCLMTEILSNESRNYRSILFFFTTNEILNFIKKFDFEFEKSSLKTHHSTFAFKYDSFIKSFTQSLFDISMLSNTFQEKILKTKFDEIMLYLIDMNGLDFLYSLINNSDNQNQKFIQIIESNSLNKLTIKELSFLSNMSVSTFKREFFKNFQSSPSKWFQDKRLEHSAYLLKTESKRPSDIYQEIGYKNLSNFIQAFKIKFGVTPKQYQSN